MDNTTRAFYLDQLRIAATRQAAEDVAAGVPSRFFFFWHAPELQGIRKASIAAMMRSEAALRIVSEAFGVPAAYIPGEYIASGAGPFGRYGGGRRARRSRPVIGLGRYAQR